MKTIYKGDPQVLHKIYKLVDHEMELLSDY